jgi:hypothetical protein
MFQTRRSYHWGFLLQGSVSLPVIGYKADKKQRHFEENMGEGSSGIFLCMYYFLIYVCL